MSIDILSSIKSVNSHCAFYHLHVLGCYLLIKFNCVSVLYLDCSGVCCFMYVCICEESTLVGLCLFGAFKILLGCLLWLYLGIYAANHGPPVCMQKGL